MMLLDEPSIKSKTYGQRSPSYAATHEWKKLYI